MTDNHSPHKLRATLEAESNGQDYTESERKDIELYLLQTAGRYLESKGFRGQVRVERKSVFSDLVGRLFG